MNLCAECGLPMAACNAMSSYRDAVKYYKLGRKETADRFAETAADWEEEYRISRNVVSNMTGD